MKEERRWTRIVIQRGSRPDDWRVKIIRALDRLDDHVLEHGHYRFCQWLAPGGSTARSNTGSTTDVSQVPRSAADPRPGGRPYYIAPECPTCGTPLVLLDQLEHPSAADAEIWYEEWICPRCRGGIWLDWPKGEWAELEAEAAASMEVGDVMSLEDLRARNP